MHQLTLKPQEMLTLLETHANGRSERKARAWACLQAVSVLSRRPDGECVQHGRAAGLHAHCELLVRERITDTAMAMRTKLKKENELASDGD